MAAGSTRHRHETTCGLISMRDLLDQVETNKKHFERSSLSVPELASSIASGSPRVRELTVTTSLPPVRELDNDPDTYMLLCLPIQVISLHGLQRRLWRCISNLFWMRPPLPCVTTTCGPIHHVRSCEYHPLSGALPYNMPIRRSTSLPSIRMVRSTSLPPNLRSSSSLPGNLRSSSLAPATSSSASSSSAGS